MRHSLVTISIFAFLLTIFSYTAKGQVEDTQELYGPEQIVYWFYVKVSNNTDPKTRHESYNLRLLSSKIYAGNADEFDVQLWRHLSKGTKLAIGPFDDYYDAEAATTFYKNFSKDTVIIDESIDKKSEAFYFLVDLFIRERSGSYGIKRIPAPIFPGNNANFAEIMKVSAIGKKLAIGPFKSQQIAEEAKRRYRLQ